MADKRVTPTPKQIEDYCQNLIAKFKQEPISRTYPTGCGNSDQPVVTCRCGAVIPNDEIDYSNRCNEEGEEYGEVTAQCNVCKADYETSQWGEWYDKNEAIEYLKDYIEGSNGR